MQPMMTSFDQPQTTNPIVARQLIGSIIIIPSP
jgi:hypothetical protein